MYMYIVHHIHVHVDAVGSRTFYTLTRTQTHTNTHSLTHSHTHSLTHSLTHTLTHTLTHSHTHSLTHSLTHTLTHSLTHSLTHTHTHSLTHTLTHTHTHRLRGRLAGRFWTSHSWRDRTILRQTTPYTFISGYKFFCTYYKITNIQINLYLQISTLKRYAHIIICDCALEGIYMYSIMLYNYMYYMYMYMAQQQTSAKYSRSGLDTPTQKSRLACPTIFGRNKPGGLGAILCTCTLYIYIHVPCTLDLHDIHVHVHVQYVHHVVHYN